MRMTRIFLLTLFALPAALQAADASKARIVTGGEKPAECISSVEVNQIDGSEVLVEKLGFDLDPGKHTLGARALINTTFCKAMGPGRQNDGAAPIEAEFEAGKTYYLGYDHSAPNRKDWKLVIWKVE